MDKHFDTFALPTELWCLIYDQLSFVGKLKAYGISKEFEAARRYSIKTGSRSYQGGVSTIEAMEILKGLCMLQLNEAFVNFFSNHPLFSCVQEVDEVVDKWEYPECFQGYALYLCFYHKNEDLLNLLVGEQFKLSKEKRQWAQLYAAGASGNPDDPLVVKLRKNHAKKDNLYKHYIEGLWGGHHYDIVACELLSEKVKFWFGIDDPASLVSGVECINEFIKGEDFDENDVPKVPICILGVLGYKMIWSTMAKTADEYLRGKADEEKLDDMLNCYILNEGYSYSYFAQKMFPEWTRREHAWCKHI